MMISPHSSNRQLFWRLRTCAAIIIAFSIQRLSGETLRYSYDSAGRLVAVDYSAERRLEFGYDVAGNLLRNTVVSSTTPPSISTQLVGQTNNAGTTANFTVSVTGTAPFSFQWYRGNSALVNGGNISGATTATLTLNP